MTAPDSGLSEALLRAVFDAFDQSPVPLAMLSADAELLHVNRAAAALVGYTQDELRDGAFALVASEDSMADAMGLLLEMAGGERSLMNADIWIKRHDETSIQVEITVAAVRDDEGQVRYFTASAADVTTRREEDRAAHHRAAHDALTELPNRSWFLSRLSQAVAHAQRQETMVGVFFIDLDGFKAINDRFGHDVGDEVLFTLAGRLDRSIRPGDTLARYGGDEFTILCEDLPSVSGATEIAERILRAVEQPLLVSVGEVGLTASIGVALGEPSTEPTGNLVTTADLAMYEAKHAGKGTYRVMRSG